MEYFRRFSSYFWSDRFWLPYPVTWDDMVLNSEMSRPVFHHLYLPIPMGLVLLAIRYSLEKHVFRSVGMKLGVKQTVVKVAPNDVLEKVFMKKGVRLKSKDIESACKQLDWTEYEVKKWLRLRKKQGRTTALERFTESAWRFTYYSAIFFYGLAVLSNKDWFWKISDCWLNYPYQNLTLDVWFYYMFSLAFYWSVCFSQFFDVKRKDFWQMFTHHIATIMLMSISFVIGIYRIGSLVIIVHDCSDMFLEIMKMAKYVKNQRLLDASFVVFTLVWVVMRLGVYPFWIMPRTIIDPVSMNGPFLVYYVLNVLLIILLILNLYWTYLIMTVLLKAVKFGRSDGDCRSSSSEGEVLDDGTGDFKKDNVG